MVVVRLNKLMMIPYTIYIILSILTLMGAYSYVSADVSYINVSSEGSSVLATNTTTSSDSATFELFTVSFLIFIGTIVAICIMAGINIFGSGLSEHAQGLMFRSIIYFGIYFALVASATPWLFASGSGEIGLIIFFVLTLMFVIGFSQDYSANSEG